MTTTIARIQNLSRSSTSLGGTDPILLDGEWSIANAGSSAPIIKVGDGVRHWSALPALMSNAPDYVAGPTVTLAPGSAATVVIDNTAVPPVISFGIPAGADGSSAPGGADTDVQYRNGGVFAGDARFTFANTTGTVTINNGKLVVVGVAGSAAVQATAASGQHAAILTASGGGMPAVHTGGPVSFNNNGAPEILLNHASAGYATIQNDSINNWSLGFTSSSSGTALGTPVVQWNATGNVNIPRPTAGSATLGVITRTGTAGVAIDVTAGGCNGVQLNAGGGFNAAFGQSTAGAAYVTAVGAASTLSLGAVGGTDVTIAADHGMFTVGATGGSKGSGTINAVGYYINGVLFTGVSPANPTAQVGTAAINGSAATYMRSDAAPAVNLAMVPTWTGAHTFAAPVATPVTITGNPAGTSTLSALRVTGGEAAGIVGVVNIEQNAGTGPALAIYPTGGNPGILILPTGISGANTLNINQAAAGGGLIQSMGTGATLAFGAVGGTDLTIAADHGIFTVGATGGSKGSGTINAKDYYNDGVLLTAALAGNPTQSVGLAIVNGAAATFLRSDSAPALDQSIAPTWTGVHHFTPSGSATPVVITGPSSTTVGAVQVSAHAGAWGIGIDVTAGANAIVASGGGSFQLALSTTTAGTGYLTQFGAASTLSFGANGGTDVTIAADHGVVTVGATGGSKGSGTINATGLYVNGVALASGGPANPTALVGTAAINGSAVTVMRSDAAPAINQAMAPTWTAKHIFHPSPADIAGVFFGTSASVPAVQVSTFAGSSGVSVDVSAGGNAFIASGGGSFQLALSTNTAGAGYLQQFGTGGTLALGIGGTTYVSIANPGNVTIGPPASGAAAQITSVSGGQGLIIQASATAFALNVNAAPSAFTNSGKPLLLFNQTGAAYSGLQNDGTDQWSIAVGISTGFALGTKAISWKTAGTVSIPISPMASNETRPETGVANFKASTTTAANNTLALDSSLTVTINETGQYKFEIFLKIFETGLGSGGFKCDFSGTASISNTYFSAVGWGTALVGFADGDQGIVLSLATVTTASDPSSWLKITGHGAVTVAGTVGVRWAQNTTTAGNPTSVNVGSYIIATKIG